MRRGLRRTARLTLGALLVLIAAPAQAYECADTSNESELLSAVWVDRCIPYYINDQSALLSVEAHRDEVHEAFRVWSSPDCTDLTFAYAGETEWIAGHSPNGCGEVHVVMAVEDQAGFDEHLPDPATIGMTQVRYSTDTGEIIDADIILNAFHFDLTVGIGEAPCEETADIRHIMVHEVGHFIGFAHNPLQDSVMFASGGACSTENHELLWDDANGVCEVYHKGQPIPEPCHRHSGAYPDAPIYQNHRHQCDHIGDYSCRNTLCGCTSVASRPSASRAALAVLLVLGWAAARRSWGR